MFKLFEEKSLLRSTAHTMSTQSGVTLADVKEVDNQTKDTVFGYIRQVIEPFLSSEDIHCIIPTLVYHWCILYYRIVECFDPDALGQGCILNEDRTIVAKKCHGFEYETSYLQKIVHVGIHTWKFKLLMIQGYTVNIGLWKTKYLIETGEFLDQPDKQYAYQVSHGCLTEMHEDGFAIYTKENSYRKPCVTGDVIEMTLDLDERTIRFNVNEVDLGIAYKDIEQVSYRAAVGLYMEDDSIQLIFYQGK